MYEYFYPDIPDSDSESPHDELYDWCEAFDIGINYFVKQLAGNKPTMVSVRILKNGYKEMDSEYFKMTPDWFKNAYIADYGQAAWDARQKMLVDDVVSREQGFEKLRTDLSSPQ